MAHSAKPAHITRTGCAQKHATSVSILVQTPPTLQPAFADMMLNISLQI